MQQNKPAIFLGTAMWGWTTSRETAFSLLDAFYTAGGRQVDAATNYPINKIPTDFRKAEGILREWIQTQGIHDLKIMMKVGSVNNMRTPEHNLRKSFLMMCLDEYRGMLGSNLDTFMIHWDNREDEAEIRDTLEALVLARQQGLRVGLSGIRYPDRYAKLNLDYALDFCIQIKLNLLQNDYARYRDFHGTQRFIAYGMNAGGIKLAPEDYRPDASLSARGGDPLQEPSLVQDLRQWLATLPTNSRRPNPSLMNHLGMLYAWYHPDVAGLLLGPSRLEQLHDSLYWAEQLRTQDYSDLYHQLRALAI